MTLRTCQRDTPPPDWQIGRRISFAGKVWELAEIEGDKYHWIAIRDKGPGDTLESVNEVSLPPSSAGTTTRKEA